MLGEVERAQILEHQPTFFWAGQRSTLAACAFLCSLLCGFSSLGLAANAQQPAPAAPTRAAIAAQDPRAAGSISGTVKDITGATVAGATVKLSPGPNGAGDRETISDVDGTFSFSSVAPGAFKLSIAEEGLASVVVSGKLSPGQALQVPEIELRIASTTMEIEALSPHDIAEVDVKQEEEQRILGFAPNFYVSYDWHARPIDARQKFELANRSIIDPINILLVGATAGINQATNAFPGYMQGAQGYAKRFGAGFADFAIGTELGGAILPVLFREDPRYFYKGTGSIKSRVLYAASTSVMGRTDKGKWGVSYSSILGDFGTGAISNLYYPASSRQGATLTIENGALGLAYDSLGNIIQEFILRRVTPKLPPPDLAAPTEMFRPAGSQ